MGISGKIIIVTGASRGLGKRIAETLAASGATVVATARRKVDGDAALDRVVEGILARGGRATAVRCDSSSEVEVRQMVDWVVGTYGRIDGLINNAAIRLSSKLLDTTPAELEHIFRVNVMGPFLLWRHVVPVMIERGGGNVINVVSTNAPQQPFFGMAPYRMTKVALTYLSADLAMEVRDDKVAVNAFDPGPVVSEGTAAIRLEREQRYGVKVPYHAQDPVEVIDEPIVWLASQTVDTFTGQFVRRVDFGRTWGPGVVASSG